MRIDKKELLAAISQETDRIKAYYADDYGIEDLTHEDRVEATIYGLMEGEENAISNLFYAYGGYPLQYRDDMGVDDIDAFHETLEEEVRRIVK